MTILQSSVLTETQLRKYEKQELIQMIIALQAINNKRLNELEGYALLRSTVKAFLDRKCDETTLKRVMGAR